MLKREAHSPNGIVYQTPIAPWTADGVLSFVIGAMSSFYHLILQHRRLLSQAHAFRIIPAQLVIPVRAFATSFKDRAHGPRKVS
jgi:hypothetical protein